MRVRATLEVEYVIDPEVELYKDCESIDDMLEREFDGFLAQPGTLLSFGGCEFDLEVV